MANKKGSRIKRKYKVADVVNALDESFGAVYLAARKVGCSPQTIYNYIAEFPEVKEVYDRLDGETTDLAEVALRKAILGGEPWAIQFRLKTKGKSRGYTERQELEHTGKDGGPIVITAQAKSQAEEELAQWREQQQKRLNGSSAQQMQAILPTPTE